MNRPSIVFIGAALLAATLADAQEPCGTKAKPTACFVDSALTSLDDCQTASLPRNSAFACIAEGEALVEPLYEKAIYASEHNSHTGLLKDFHASWRAAMDGILPNDNEPPAAYKARQAAYRNALEAKAERLKVD